MLTWLLWFSLRLRSGQIDIVCLPCLAAPIDDGLPAQGMDSSLSSRLLTRYLVATPYTQASQTTDLIVGPASMDCACQNSMRGDSTKGRSVNPTSIRPGNQLQGRRSGLLDSSRSSDSSVLFCCQVGSPLFVVVAGMIKVAI